jgi:hypothetical protein
MKTKLVTAIYTGISGHPYYGHEAQSRHHRYLHSLRTLNGMGIEIICYVNENQSWEVRGYCDDYELTNVTVKVSELSDYPYAEKMRQVKELTDDYKFYHEVDWNKLHLLEKEYDESYSHIYWIDSGLSHRGLFTLKYNPYRDNLSGFSTDYENYAFTGIFCPELFPKINQYIGDKLLNLNTTFVSHYPNAVSDVFGSELTFPVMSVGGIIGGSTTNLLKLIDEFKELADICLSKNAIINHEAMISVIVQKNEEIFKTFTFDTWYHDDFWLTTPKFDRDYIKDKVHFVHFFEKELGI